MRCGQYANICKCTFEETGVYESLPKMIFRGDIELESEGQLKSDIYRLQVKAENTVSRNKFRLINLCD